VATALVAAVGNAISFANGRDLAAWLGLVPSHSSTGGRTRLLGISKRRNPYVRRALILGAHSVLISPRRERHGFGRWLLALQARARPNVVVVALANKLARIAYDALILLPQLLELHRRGVSKDVAAHARLTRFREVLQPPE
jgi:transposase